MEFRFSDEDEAFRADVQAFLAAELPAWWQSSVDGRDDDERWRFTRSFQKRLAGPNPSWPAPRLAQGRR